MHKTKQLLLNRIMAVLLVVFMLLPSIPVFAVSGSSVSVGTASGQPGDQVSVTVSVSGNPGIAYLKLKIGYDASQLTLTGATNSGLLTGTFTTSKTTDTNPYVLQWMGAENATGNGVAATLTFQIASNASAGDKEISVSVDECYNESFDDVTLSPSNGKVTVESESTKTLTSISVQTNPTKTTYYIGDSLNTSGLTLKLTYSDGSTENVLTGFTTSGFSSTSAGTKTVTVIYEGFTDTFTVVIKSSETITGTYNDLLSYSITDGEVTITKCVTSASGSLTIPDTIQGYPVRYIKSYAFVNCTSINSLTIPNTVLSIGSYAFNGCTSLKYVYGAEGVHTIAEYAFQKCTALYRVNFGNELAIIGVSAFSGCTGLTTYINFGDKVQIIGGNAFYECTSLKTVSFSDSVTYIGDRAFQGCTALTGIRLGNGIKTVGAFAFENCPISRIENVDLASWCGIDFANSDSVPSGKLIFTETLNEDNLPIPEEVTTIHSYTFYIHSLDVSKKYRAMTIPDTVTLIEEGAINSSTLIYGYRNSAAEEYAETNGNKFIALDGLTKIVISSGPSKTAYYVGDSYSDSGIRLTVYCDNGLTDNSVQSGYKTSGYDMSVAGEQTVTVEYLGLTTTYTINVKKPSVSLSTTSMKLNVGESSELSGTSVPSGKSISWNSSNESVATYSGGKVNAISNGTAVITASFTYNGIEYYGECTVVVTDIDSIAISSQPSKSVYYIGDSLDTSGLAIDLYSSDGSKKTVSSGYTVSGFDSSSAGTKTVTVSYDGLTTTFNVTVKTPIITLSSNSKSMAVGDSSVITATTTPSGQTVTWTSSNTSVATVSGGTITAKASGSATITAKFTYNGITYSKTCSITVEEPVVLTGMTLYTHQLTKTSYYIGDSLNTSGLELYLTYSDGSTEYVTSGFSTSGFSSTTAGTKTITVSYEGFTDTFTVTVKTPSITLSSSSKAMLVGDSSAIIATTTPSGQTVTWTSSNTSVATVSGGTITAKAAGTATITAKFTYNGIAYSKNCSVTVSNPVVTISSISVYTNPTKTNYYIGDSLNTSGLVLRLAYSDGSTETVSSGFTTSGFGSTSAGTKTVTVSYQGKTTTFNVTVNTPSISLSSTSKSMTVGGTATVTATTTPSGQTVTWTSSNTSVATVSGGTITAKSAGTAIITAKFTYNGITYSKTCSVTVANAPSPEPTLSSISIATKPTKTTYEIGESLNTSGLTLKLTYSDGSTETVSSGFTTSGFSSATAGTKTVTVSYGGKTTSFTVTVKATSVPEDSAQLIMSGSDTMAGKEVTLTLAVKNNPGIAGLAISLKYDENVLTLKETKNGGLFSGFTAAKNFAWDESENVTNDGVLATFIFTVAEDAPAGDYNIEVLIRSCTNENLDDVELLTTNGIVSVIDFVYGDSNGDQKIDMKDVVLLRKYITNFDYDTNTSSVNVELGADANGDNKIDMKDVVILRKYITNYDYDTESSTVVLGPQ